VQPATKFSFSEISALQSLFAKMNITKKFDRAFQWAGEKMGAEAKTSMSDDFKQLETEMALRFDGKSSPYKLPLAGPS